MDGTAGEILGEILGERLAELGYVEVAEGQRGRVYLPPGAEAHAVKLFPADDLAYLSLLRYTLDHPSPHLPRVLHGPVPLDDGTGWAVVIERLDAPDDELSDHLLDEAGGFLLDVLNGDRDDDAARPGRWGSGLDASLRHTLLGIGRILLRGHGFLPDESAGNLLMRGDVPVLSDILCGRNGRAYAGTSPGPHDDGFAVLLDPAPAPRP